MQPNNFLTKKISLRSSLAKMTTINGQLNESENTFFFFLIWREITDKTSIWHPFFTADSHSTSIFKNIFNSDLAIGSATQ